MKKILVFLVFCLALGAQASAQTYNEAQKELDKYINSLEKRVLYLEKHPSQTSQKEMSGLIATIDSLHNLRLSTGKAYLYKRTATGVAENIPEEMSGLEYRRRERSLAYQVSRKIVLGNKVSEGLSGLLVNYKTGVNELAEFVISRTDVSGLPADVVCLNPGEHLVWKLMPGNYEARITCGSYRGLVRFTVGPDVIKHFDGQSVYWFCAKTMADW